MAILKFESLVFKDAGKDVEVSLLNNFYFTISKEDLRSIGEFELGRNHIEFKGLEEKRASSRFNLLIAEGMKRLKSRLNGNPAVYVHRNSGIPLIGSIFFGIVDRGTTIIELKPITGCNINCIFCSVDEGISSRKQTEFVVEEGYMIEELRKLLEYKKNDKIEIFINPHGEPLLYGDIVKLVEDLKKIRQIKKVSIATNGSLLTKGLIDDLSSAGLDSLNISVNSLDEKNARMLAGTKEYDIKKTKEMIEYAKSTTRIKIVIAPVWINGFNDKDIKDIIDYCSKNDFELGIQKYVKHKKGRNPKKAEETGWEDFFSELRELEKEHKLRLLYPSGPEKTRELPKPFRTGDTISAAIVSQGRYADERIAAAQGRAITAYGCNKAVGQPARIRIIKSKDSLFFGKCV